MVITLIICSLLVVLSLIVSKNRLFSPAVITSGIWTLIISLYGNIGVKLNPLTDNFFIAINTWVILFCLSSLLMQSLHVNKKSIVPSQLTRNILFFFSLATFPLLLWKAYEITKLGVSSNWMTDLRNAAVGNMKNVDINDANPFYVIVWFVAYLIELNYFSKENRFRVFALFLMYSSYAFVTMAKVHFLILFIGTIYILYTKNIFKFRQIIISFIVLCGIFIIIQNLRTESKNTDHKLIENMTNLYLLSPSAAFGKVIPASAENFGENVFRISYAIKYKLGLSSIKPVDTFLPFVNVGVGTNTYTVLYPFYKDFGVWGVGIFAVFLGLLIGYVYNKAESGNVLFLVIYSFIISQIFMQYGAEMFFTNLSLNIKRIIIILIPFFATKYELFVRNNLFKK